MDQIIQEQIAYYRARAQEYDEWWYRQGRYDRGEQFNRQWVAEAQVVRDQLRAIGTVEHILELAPGTGIWTQELVKQSQRVTAVDASPEMIAINQAKVQSDRVTYIEADLFNWQSSEQYDLVFFSFWLSHVPPETLAPFLQKVRSMLKPDGHVFMLDSRKIHESTAHDHHLPEDGTTMERKLNDGRKFQIVKIFYEVEPLRQALLDAGIKADVMMTEQFFIYAKSQPTQQ